MTRTRRMSGKGNFDFVFSKEMFHVYNTVEKFFSNVHLSLFCSLDPTYCCVAISKRLKFRGR